MIAGTPTRRIDWVAHTTGAVRFTDDLHHEGALIARFLRSPHPHARIDSIDVSAARTADGVAAVITSREIGPEVRYLHHGGNLADRRPLADDRVRFIGEEVAAVAAETRDQAEAALALIDVRYRPLPAFFTPDGAGAKRAPVIHEHRPDNVAFRVRRRWGGTSESPAATVSGRYYFNRQTHFSMETNRTTARWHPHDEILELWTSTQVPYFVRKEVALALGLERDQVKIREVAVGGGFGSKSKICEHEVLVAALAVRTGPRPVSLVYDREEEFAATKPRHDFLIDLTVGASRDGRLLTQDARITVDNGAYNHYGPSVTAFGCSILASLYPVAQSHLDADLVYTNKQPGGQFRGYGAPQTTFAMECAVDELADALAMDPIDLRLRNLHRPGTATLAGWNIVDTHLDGCLLAAAEAIRWEERRAAGGSGRGVGIAAAIHPSGSHSYEGAERSEARVTVGADGKVEVGFGGADPGTGQRTLLAQAAAHELGLSPDDIAVVMMDSDATPTDLGSWSSRGTFMGVSAVRDVAATVAAALVAVAAEKTGADAGDITLLQGYAVAGADRVALGDLAVMADGGGPAGFTVEGGFTSATEMVTPEGVANLSETYSFAAQAVAVEVDEGTGEVRLLDVVAAHDSGTAINPIDVEGQITGGVAMGLGAALGEEVIYEQGRVVGPGFVDYALPRAADLPPIRPILIDHPDPRGPYGAKGLGEIVLNPTAAAVANAVSHALGVRIREIPITPDRVLAAIAERDGYPRRVRRPRRLSVAWNALIRWMYPRGLLTVLHRWGTRFAKRRRVDAIRAVYRPRSLDEATRLAASADVAPVGGATDIIVARRQGIDDRGTLLDVRAIPELERISVADAGATRIGAAVRLAELLDSPLTAAFPALREAVALIASPQIRASATVGGNLCQQKRCWFYRSGFSCYKAGGFTCPCYAVVGDHRFYHAALGAHRCQAVTPSDLATVLPAFDATVEIAGSAGSRRIPMIEFYAGPGEPDLRRGEIVTAVTIPAEAGSRRSAYEKLTRWHGDFAMASVAVSARVVGAVVHEPRVILGAVAPTPYRARSVEEGLAGRPIAPGAMHDVTRLWHTEADPLPGTLWKLAAASGLLARALERLVA